MLLYPFDDLCIYPVFPNTNFMKNKAGKKYKVLLKYHTHSQSTEDFSGYSGNNAILSLA
jgi:hypothetical protein